MAPFFTGSPLDRADAVRSSPDAVAALLAHPDSRALAMRGLDPELEGTRLRWERPGAGEHLLLGLQDGAARFVAVPREDAAAALTGPADWRVLAALDPGDAAIWGGARAVLSWHARHGFCAHCGAGTTLAKAGWSRRCPSCGAEHFPRVDPVVIMLAVHGEPGGDLVLLGRQPRFPPRRYSALAGFVEPGESLEEAVRRELMEEAGVPTASVHYLASQPWPFPSSLMVACVAEATGTAITLDETELDDARWFTRDEVTAAMAGEADAAFIAPPPFAIAHTLLTAWLEDVRGTLAAAQAND